MTTEPQHDTNAKQPSAVPPYRKLSQKRPTRNVLFLCHDNSIASIMAEALLRRIGGEYFRAFSAGNRPNKELNPLTVEVLKGRRVWQSDLRPKSWRELLSFNPPKLDLVINLGECRPENTPSEWPGNPLLLHWHISEPDLDGEPQTKLRAFRATLTELETRIRLLVLVFEKEDREKLAA